MELDNGAIVLKVNRSSEAERVGATKDLTELYDRLPSDAREGFAQFVEKEGLDKALVQLLRENEKSGKTTAEIFFEEINKEYRTDNFCPSLEEVRGMDKVTLQIMTKNAIYMLMRDHLQLRERLNGYDVNPEEAARIMVELLDTLWNSRSLEVDRIEVIDKERYEEAKTVLEKESLGPLTEDENRRYQKLRKEQGEKGKMKERDKAELDRLTQLVFAWELSPEARKEKSAKEKAREILGQFTNNEEIQRDVQVSLAYEARYQSGAEFADAFEDVAMNWLMDANRRISIGNEEKLIKIREAIEEWGITHVDDASVAKEDQDQSKKLSFLKKHFWDFYVNIATAQGWNDEPETTRKAKVNQFLVIVKKVADLMKMTGEV